MTSHELQHTPAIKPDIVDSLVTFCDTHIPVILQLTEKMPDWQPTQEQHMWLMPHLTKFKLRVPHSKEPAFWAQLNDQWLLKWPEQTLQWPDHLAGDVLTEDEEKELSAAEKARKQAVAGLLMDVVSNSIS
ncbi:uncharacterized protein BJ212DRAFT_1299609 [Suillus subaureus]|uniref:Uncharacterized protein n=1 Tax=Suillus subaureus TaxID=48587 RepID=A0A9P7EBV3_9AGAM|nr:uncharacterized protein BJ212DRAFT_1299609 [Suillus subaureus]KAG1816896.1 hypothetical protein BJ212DRAFT_1299609 [Suillus subaureus]